MMASLDAYLARKGALPHQRPMTGKTLVGQLIGASVHFGGGAFGFGQNDPTIERVGKWFKEMYGERLNSPFRSRSVVLDLRGTIWRMRLGITFGSPTLFMDRDPTNQYSILRCIEELTPAYAQRLTEAELDHIMAVLELGFPAIEALGGFEGNIMFNIAWLDYEHSVDALMSSIDWGKARWETAQTAEKIMKGMLVVEGQTYPKGRDGHIIPKLGRLVADHFKVSFPAGLLETIDCKPDVRYGDEEATREEAMAAHYALLQLLPLLFQVFYTTRPKTPRVRR